MALTGKFLADFSAFSAAVQRADVELRGMETGAGKVGVSLNRMVDSFSGRKIIQDATLAAEAVTRIGGASKLTASEQDKVNRTVTEALAKYKALGIEAPAALQKIAAETKQIPVALGSANTGLSTLMTGLKSAAGLLGIAFSARAVIGFVGGVFDAASKVKDLSTQLGISTGAVQGFKFAAEQSGSSLDAVGTAIQKMNQKLGEGDKSTVTALADVGLKFQDIRAMKPEDAFLRITDQIQKIEDPMKRAAVAVDLFGKGAAEILPAIEEGFRKTASGASKMSEQTIKDLEAAQDAWEQLLNKVTIVSGGIIAETMRAASQATRSWQDFFTELARMGARNAGMPLAGIVAPAGSADGLTAKQREFDAAFNAKFKAQQQGVAGGDKPPTAASLGTKAIDQHAVAVKALMDAFSGAKVIATANLHLEAIAGNMRQGIPLAQMTRTQQDAINKSMAEAQEVYRTLGRDVPPAIRAVYLATLDLSKGIPVVAGLSSEFAKLGTSIKVLPTYIPLVEGLGAEFGKIGAVAAVAGDAGETVGMSFRDSMTRSLEQAGVDFIHSIGAALRGQEDALWHIGESAGATIGAGIGGYFGGPLGAAIGEEIGAWVGGLLDSIFGFQARAVNDARDTFLGQFGGGGTDMGSGFRTLADDLHALGAAGDEMFQRLIRTEDMAAFERAVDEVNEALGRIRADSPQGLIEASGFQTQAQLQGVADKALIVYNTMRESGLYTAATLEEAWKRYQGALEKATSIDPGAQKALDAVKALDDQLAGLFKSIENEAPEEVMGIIEANTRAQIAGIQKERDAAQLALEQTAGDAAKTAEEAAKLIEQTLGAHDFRVKVKIDLDDPSGILSGRTASGILSRGSGSYGPAGDGGNITIVSQTVLDGEVLAESLATTLKRQGVR